MSRVDVLGMLPIEVVVLLIGELSDIQVADRIVRLNSELEGRITVMFYPKTSEKLYMMFKCLLDLIVWIEVIEAE